VGRETDQELNAFEVEELWAEPGTARVNVSTDGEVSIMDAPLHYRIRHHALDLIVPMRRPSDDHSISDNSERQCKPTLESE
jgi:hypothetical protein